jgi:hypothetical protein
VAEAIKLLEKVANVKSGRILEFVPFAQCN